MRLLIDADELAIKAAFVHNPNEDTDETTLRIFDPEWSAAACYIAECMVERLKGYFQTNDVLLCWSDITGRYFRHDLFPEYKSNRKGQRRARYRRAVRAHLLDLYPNKWVQGLEADDVMGIEATTSGGIIVSGDKDMMTIPDATICRDMSWNEDETTPRIEHTTAETAHRFHMLQTLMGDNTDGIPGLKGVGPKKAAKVLDEADELWPAVLERYGEGETHTALLMARLTCILHSRWWDEDAQEAILWMP